MRFFKETLFLFSLALALTFAWQLWFFLYPAIADSVPNTLKDGSKFDSASHEAQAVLQDKKTSFAVNAGGRTLYKTEPTAANMSLGHCWLSDDGHVLVWMLASPFYGHLSDPELKKDIPALQFFHDGKMVKSYSLNELLVRPELTGETAVHTIWLPDSLYKSGPGEPNPVLSKDCKLFKFRTTSFREYTFDSASGQMIEGNDSEIWKKSEIIGCAELAKVRGGLKIRSIRVIKGSADSLQNTVIKDPTHSFKAGWNPIGLKKVHGSWVTVSSRNFFPWDCSMRKIDE